MKRVKNFWKLLKSAAAEFGKHKMMKLSASLSFFTLFSIGPMMLLIIFVSNLFWERDAVEGSLYRHIKGIVGESPARQIQEIIKDASITSHNFIAFISIVILLIAATGVFTEIQNSINFIWNLKVKKGRGLLQTIKSRLISFIMITSLGILLLLSLIINGLLEGFMDRIQEQFPHMAVFGIYVFNLLVTLLVVASLFAVIFKVMPDAVLRWRYVLPGALFTAILFMTGKFGVTYYINHSRIATSYGSAGSMIILLVWIFYSSVVLYYGAEFTKAYALKFGDEIKPRPYAVIIKNIQEISGAKSIQENEISQKSKQEPPESKSH